MEKNLTIEDIKKAVEKIAPEYGLTKVSLFGSRARGNFQPDSDVDLLVEFTTEGVSLLKIISLKHRLEDMWNLNVDIVHGPITEDDILEIDKEIKIYAA